MPLKYKYFKPVFVKRTRDEFYLKKNIQSYLYTAFLGERGLSVTACSTDILWDGYKSEQQMCVELLLCTLPSSPSRLGGHSRKEFSYLVLGEHVTKI